MATLEDILKIDIGRVIPGTTVPRESIIKHKVNGYTTAESVRYFENNDIFFEYENIVFSDDVFHLQRYDTTNIWFDRLPPIFANLLTYTEITHNSSLKMVIFDFAASQLHRAAIEHALTASFKKAKTSHLSLIEYYNELCDIHDKYEKYAV